MQRLFKYLSTALILGLILALVIPFPAMAAGSIEFSSTSNDIGPVGTSVTIRGTGFNTGDEVNISYDGDIQVTFDTTSTTFSKSFKIPSSASGDHVITAVITGGTPTNSLSFTVTPSITLNKSSAGANTQLIVYGWGFGQEENDIKTTFNGEIIGTAQSANTEGYWTNTITIPYLTPGNYSVGADGNTTDPTDVQEAVFTIISTAAISLSKNLGPAGSPVTVYGTGFAPNESSIVVTFGTGTNFKYSPTSVSSTGTWNVTFNVPSAAGGTYVIDVYGAKTLSSAVTDQTFSVTAQLKLSKASGPPQTEVIVTGTGFTASEAVDITWDGLTTLNSTTTNALGVIASTVIEIPQGASPGTHKISANTTEMSFIVGAGISLDKTTGRVGETITINGGGFGINDKNISVTFEGVSNPVATILKTTANGTWTANFAVPPSAGGDHTITATVGSTKVTTTFTTLPGVKLDTVNASAGSIVSASGSGFSANQKNINVKFDDTEVVGNITASSTGAWTTSFSLPAAASGNHVIKIAGTEGLDLSVPDISFKIKPALSLSLENAPVGATVVIKGTGFVAGSAINITYDDNNFVKTTALADGSFSKSVVIPTSKAGEHEIKASDSTNIVTAVFIIDSTAPTVPKPISPTDAQRLGFMSKITPSFTWSKVTASSQITYNFQLDSDPEFSNPLEKSGLTVTKYTVSRTEALPRGEYYWRVKAIDAAGNESPWSQAQYLKSGLISPFLFTLILILLLAGLAYGVFFLLTKFLPRRRAAQISATSPEIVIPEIVNAEFKQIESGKSALPWRLALPQAPQQAKGSKNLSSEDQARLKVIIDFAKSLPLPQPDSNTGWLVELAENVTGNSISPSLYTQLLKGEIQVRYEPAWMHHPTFLDLQALLEGQPIMQDLTTFVDSVNNLTSSASQVLQDIYHDVSAQVSWDLISNGGWAYISGIYTDGVGWFLGKNLREPSDRDYSVKAESAADGEQTIMGVYGDQNTSFAGLLAKAPGETEAQQLRALHLKLRRNYRSSDKLKDLVSLITQLEFQRNRLLNAFSQFNRLST